MKSVYRTALLIWVALFSVESYAVDTAFRNIEKVSVDGTGADAVYYFYNQTEGWGANGCASAFSVYILENSPGAKSILSLALTAKSTGIRVSFKGTCGGDYMDVNHITLE